MKQTRQKVHFDLFVVENYSIISGVTVHQIHGPDHTSIFEPLFQFILRFWAWGFFKYIWPVQTDKVRD